MRILVSTSLLILLLCGFSQAAERAGSNAIFSGFAFANAGLIPDRSSLYGVGANYARYLGDRDTAIVGDFSIQVRSSDQLMYFLGGVRHSFSSDPADIFLEGLVGISYLNLTHGESVTCPAYGGGGGIDWNLGPRFAIRAPQVDFLWGNHEGENFYDVRIQVGATFHF